MSVENHSQWEKHKKAKAKQAAQGLVMETYVPGASEQGTDAETDTGRGCP